jgi:MarR family
MTEFLESKRQEIDKRIAELAPLISEYERLQEAARVLKALPDPGSANGAQRVASARVPARRGPGRPRVKSAPDGGRSTAKVGRRKGSGKRQTETLSLIVAHPGITVSELAKRMGIKATYLYRVLPDLQKEGKVRKQDHKWHPSTPATE